MIITCPCDKKKFDIDASMIPNEGRNLQCGFCGHVWFYRKNIIENEEPINEIKKKEITLPSKKNKPINNNIDKIEKKALVKFENESNFTFSKFLSYLIVMIISFLALLILIDTFKTLIYQIFPGLENYLFSFFEVLKDIMLFINDLF